MELTSMFLNQLTGNNGIERLNTSTGNKGFEQVFNNVQTNKSNNYSQKFKDKNNEINNKNNEKILSDKKNDNYKVENKNFTKENKKVENKSIDDNNETKDKAIIVDDETLNELSKVLDLPKDRLIEILSNLSMSVSMLQNGENLVGFLQMALDVNSPQELLSINNIRDIMSKVTDIAKNIRYDDLICIDENFKSILENIIDKNNIENINIINSDIREKIDVLLQDLNGKVVSSKSLVLHNNENTNGDDNKIDLLNTAKEDLSDIQNIKQISNDKAYYNQNSGQFNNNQNNNDQLSQSNIKQDIFAVTETSNDFKLYNSSLPKTQALKNINTSDVVAQIMDKIKVSIKTDVSEIKMILKPEQLGEVSLKIATQNGVVTAQFIAESQKVKEIIESNFNQLRDMLLDQGIDVGALEVNISNSNDQEQKFNMFEQDNKNKDLDNSFSQNNKIEIKEENKKAKENEILESKVNYSI